MRYNHFKNWGRVPLPPKIAHRMKVAAILAERNGSPHRQVLRAGYDQLYPQRLQKPRAIINALYVHENRRATDHYTAIP